MKVGPKVFVFLSILFVIPSVFAEGAKNRAAVSWVLYDNRKDFKSSPERIKSMISDQDQESQFFNIPEENHFKAGIVHHIDNEGTGTFKGALQNAIHQIKDTQNPELFIIVDSHGDVGEIQSQYGD